MLFDLFMQAVACYVIHVIESAAAFNTYTACMQAALDPECYYAFLEELGEAFTKYQGCFSI